MKSIYTFLFFLTLITSQSVTAQWHSDTQAIMGTEVRVVLWHNNAEQGAQAIADAMVEMHRIDNTYNPWNDQSELYRVNQQAANKAVAISDEMVRLLDKSLYYSQLTKGAFDISFASLGHGYDYRTGKKPTAKQRSESVIDYRLIQLKGTSKNAQIS